MRQIILVIIFFLNLVLNSCKKDNPSYFKLPVEFKEWCTFGEESYWINKKNLDPDIDSIYVTTFQNDYFENSVDNKSDFFEIIFIKSNGENINSTWWISKNISNSSLEINEELLDLMLAYKVFFSYKDGIETVNDSVNTVSQLDSLIVLNKTYYNIIYIKESRTLKNLYNNEVLDGIVELWLSKDIGIIKRIITYNNTNIIYELDRYKIYSK